VEPTRSAKRSVTTRRSTPRSLSRTPHPGQK
jgi:hypothetical protein